MHGVLGISAHFSIPALIPGYSIALIAGTQYCSHDICVLQKGCSRGSQGLKLVGVVFVVGTHVLVILILSNTLIGCTAFCHSGLVDLGHSGTLLLQEKRQ